MVDPPTRRHDHMDDERYCPYFHHTVELLGRRWTGVILRVLAAGPARYGDIRTSIPGLSDRLLTRRLAELESEGIVRRCEREGSACWGLTGKGRLLEPVLDAIADAARALARIEVPAERPGRIRTA